jgi:peptide/nickel transport system ATP-binding protein
MSAPLLRVRRLAVDQRAWEGVRTLIDDVSLDLAQGEILGLVGESGAGKSLLARSLVRLLPPTLHIARGEVLLDGRDLTRADEAEMRAVRGARIGMVFQNPTSYLDPVMRIGDQVAQGIRLHGGLGARAARMAAVETLAQVGLPEQRYAGYAHEFSGGMRQRAMIAIALACNPQILFADEPTAALDVTVQAQILRLLLELRERRGLAVVLITHDLALVAQTCDRIAVMRGGRIVESGEKRRLLAAPRDPHTAMLIRRHPSTPHQIVHGPARLARATSPAPLLEVEDLEVRFSQSGLLPRARRGLPAVNGVCLRVLPGESVGVVGESGSGKTTLARAVLGLAPITSGHVRFAGGDLTRDRTAVLARLRREAAMVFQDPYNALNPRLTIGQALAEVLTVQGRRSAADVPRRVGELLDLVALDRAFADRRPRTMSGGQCQRAGIARALAVEPKLLITDECVAALDAMVQDRIIALLRGLKERMRLTLLFIAHDLALVRNLCDRVVVMRQGEIVEEGSTEHVFSQPQHPYTAALIAAIPGIDPDRPFHEAGAASGDDRLDEGASA